MNKRKIGYVVVFGGSIVCLLLAFAWIVNAIYWHNLTDSWLDPHITDYELAPVFCIAGIYFLLYIAAPFFDMHN